jgi:hypothetical protein
MSKKPGEPSGALSEDLPLDPRTVELLERMSEDDWLAAYNALVIYACKRCAGNRGKRLRWRTGQVRGAVGTRDTDKDANLPEGFSPQAIAHEAVSLLFGGIRTWNHEKYPDESPLEFLKGTVDSIVSELIESASHRGTTYIEDEETRTDGEGGEYKSGTAGVKDVQSTNGNPESHAYLQSVADRIRERVSNRTDLTRYFELCMEGRRRGEISECMGVKPERVSELRSQFLERTSDIYQELLEPTRTGMGKKGGAGGAS